MKKLAILFVILSTLFLASCGENKQEIKQNVDQNTQKQNMETKNIIEDNKQDIQKEEVKKVEEVKDEIQEVQVPQEPQEEKTSFKDIENNLKKLQEIGVNQDDLRFINDELKSFYQRKVEEQAVSKKDINICNKLETNKDSCKQQVAVFQKNISLCKNLSSKQAQINCANTILQQKAQSTLNETLCDKLVDNTEEKFLQKSCKTQILLEKARKNLDEKICNQIQEEGGKQMCLEMVKTEKEIKAKEEK